jgi:hypothetical protein
MNANPFHRDDHFTETKTRRWKERKEVPEVVWDKLKDKSSACLIKYQATKLYGRVKA